jgi:hypothetical protein
VKNEPNHSIQRTGASRLGQSLFTTQWRLAPAADSWSLDSMKALCIIVHVVVGIIRSQGSIASEVVPIVNIDPSSDFTFDEGHGDAMVGWSFQLLVPFTVTKVGWYDEGSNGLSRPFQVGLWGELGGLSMIGDLNNGLIIPAGTNATLSGTWRVVDLAEPLLLPPGSYILGGLDTSTTRDVIKYVAAGDPGYQSVVPPGCPVVIGQFFYGQMETPGVPPKFGPPTSYYLWWGLELGPMLFGTNGPATSTGFGLSVTTRTLPAPLHPVGLFVPPPPPFLILTWLTGTLLQADTITGPYVTVTNGASPYVIQATSARKLYRLGP